MKDNRSFLCLSIGQTLANLGDVFYIVGIISYLYMNSSSVFLVSLIPFCLTISRFIGGFISPLILDKFQYKKILIYVSLIKTVLLCLLFLLIDFNIVIIFIFVGIIAFLDGWCTPARNAMIPGIVGKEQLAKANSILSIFDQTVQLVGWSVGAVIVSLFSGKLLIGFTIILFAISTIMMISIKFVNLVVEKEKTYRLKESLGEGWTYIRHSSILKTIIGIDIINSIASTVWIAAILYVYVDKVLNKSEAWWGYINTSFFLGLMVGGFIVLKLGKLNHQYKLFLITTILISIFTLFFAFPLNAIYALIISFIIGIPTQILEIAQTTLLQTKTEDYILAKVFSARDVILTSVFGLSSLIFGALADILQVQIVFIIASALLIISSVWVYIRRKSFVF